MDKASLVMKMRLTWKEGMYKILCTVKVRGSMAEPNAWVKIVVPLGKEIEIDWLIW